VAETLVLYQKLEESALLRVFVLKRCRYNGVIKINRLRNQSAFGWNFPDLAGRPLAQPYAVDYIRMIDDEPKEPPPPGFRW
jgi:hypothetical protein